MATWIASGYDLTILCPIKGGFRFNLRFVYTVFCLFGAKFVIQITLIFSLCCDSLIHLLLRCLFIFKVGGFNILRHFRKTGHQIEIPV
jgi:hypothetical protein